MSLIPGGRADKSGNRFERLWVVHLALRVMDGRLTSLQWERLGPEGEGVECVVTDRDGWKTYYQCKIQNGNKGTWTVYDLGKKMILQTAKRRLETDPRCTFGFVSDDKVRTLHDMSSQAKSCDADPIAFVDCLKSREIKKSFNQLCEFWDLSSQRDIDIGLARALLARMEFRRGYWDAEVSNLYRQAEGIVDAEGEKVVAFLAEHLEQQMGNTQDATHFMNACKNYGFSLCDLSRNPSVALQITKLKNRFREALEPHLIEKKELTRPESQALLSLALTEGKSKLIFMVGEPGCGKSGVLLQLMHQLEQQEIPYLPIRLDTDYPEGSVRSFSKSCLDLPCSPSKCLRDHSGSRRAVLLIDQLDAIRWTSRNSQKAWQICKEILDEALRCPEMTVVVVGRTIDFADDPQIKRWKEEHLSREEVSIENFTVGALPEEEVATLLGQYGMAYAPLLPKEKEILGNCQNLKLWTELAQHGTVQGFESRAKLLQKVWAHYRRKSSEEDGLANCDMNACLRSLVSWMEKNGRLDAPKSLSSSHSSAAKSLQRLGIISIDDSRIRFSHQSHLDYLIVEDILDKALLRELEPIRWLRDNEQHLGRRDQVRLLLQLIRGDDQAIYLAFLREIFTGESIRFHIQHLALATLGHVMDPRDEEVQLVMELWEKEVWRIHVLEQVLMGHSPWLCRLTENGTVPDLLASQDEAERNQALRLCKGSATTAPEWFEQILSPYWQRQDDQWGQIISDCLSIQAEKDTEAVFGWRLELARQGNYLDDHLFELHLVDELARHDRGRAGAFLSAVMGGYIQYCSRKGCGNGPKRIEMRQLEYNHIAEACQSEPGAFWNQLLPAFRASAALVNDLEAALNGLANYDQRVSGANIIGFLHRLLKVSGAERLKSERTAFIDELAGLIEPSIASHLCHLIVDVLSSAPVDFVDEAINCFLRLESPLEINVKATSGLLDRSDFLSPHDPAINFLKLLAKHCSNECFQALENVVLNFHSAEEKETVTQQLELIKEQSWEGKPNYYGLPQYALLLSFPTRRLSAAGAKAKRTWERKFGDLQKYRNARRYDLFSVISPIPAHRGHLISDASWINIVRDSKDGLKNRRLAEWKETGDGAYSESSPRRLSDSLRDAAVRMPQRYLQLGLRFPSTSPCCFFEALLTAACSTEQPENAGSDWLPASVADVEALLEHVHDKMNSELAIAFTRLIRARSDEAWSSVTLMHLRIYATQHPEPSSYSFNDDLDELEMTILNSVRCSAVSAASRLLLAHPAHLDWAKHLAQEVLNDPSPAVHAAILELSRAISCQDHVLACSLMVRACAGKNLPILSTNCGEQLIRQAWRHETHFENLFKRSLASNLDQALEQSGFWTTIGFVLHGLYPDLSAQAASGPPAARVGVAKARIALSQQFNEHRAKCLDCLSGYLNDNDSIVLDAAARIVETEGFLSWPEAPSFLAQLAESDAFLTNPSMLFSNLADFEGSLLPFSDAIEKAFAHISEPLTEDSGNPARCRWRVSLDVSKVLLHLYSEAERQQDQLLRERCLDFWDALLRSDFCNQHHLLTQIDSG